MFLSIVISAYNEEQNLESTLKTVLGVPMPAFVESVEIIIVDDCQADLAKIWDILPFGASMFKDRYFKVINTQSKS